MIPHVYKIGARPLRNRLIVGLLASVLATGAVAAPIAVPKSGEYNHHSVALFNPVSNIGTTTDRTGATNGVQMIKKWKDMGVPAQQMMGLTEVLIVTQSPVLSADPSTLEDAKALSKHTYDIFTLQNLAQINDFLSKKSITRLEIEGWLAPGSTLVNSRRATEFSQVLDVWEQYSQFTDSGVKAPLYNPDDETPEKMTQAVTALKIAIQDTGLNSLTVPLPMWSSSEHLNQVAFHLQQSNRELQSVTQWHGPVLGLKEKINLTITYGHDLSFASLANNGDVDIQASFSSLAHEWEHALEYVLAQQIGYAPAKGPALLTRAIADRVPHPIVQQWEQVGQTVDDTMRNSWYPKLKELSVRSPQNATYYANRHEHIAYTFESFVESQLPSHASLRYLPTVDRSDRIGPTAQQAIPTTKMWKDVLKYLNQHWWNPSSEISLESAQFKNKLLSRRPLSDPPATPSI